MQEPQSLVELIKNKDALQDLITKSDVKNTPVFVISITGVKRPGKSFLASLLITYLDYYVKVSSNSVEAIICCAVNAGYVI